MTCRFESALNAKTVRFCTVIPVEGGFSETYDESGTHLASYAQLM